MARLLLLRHGQSDWNAESRWQGWADPPLSEFGESQAAALASQLGGMAFQGVVSSDLDRARRTAAIVAEALGLPVEVEPALRERDVGAWEGLTTAQIDERWPGLLAAWRSRALPAPPGGEPDDAMAVRVLDALRRLAQRPEASLAVVTHKGVIRLTERWLGVELWNIPNLSGRWVHGDGPDGIAAGGPFLPELENGDGAPGVTSDLTDSR